MRMMGLAALVGVSAVALAYAQPQKVEFKADFTQDTAGQPPKGFEFGHTAKAGRPGRWVVQADGAEKYLAQLDADGTRQRFPVADSSGGIRTRTTTTSFARTRAKTTSCSTRSKTAREPICR
jgi:hypothetical protein